MDQADRLREPLLAKGTAGTAGSAENTDSSGFFAAGSKASSVVVLISAAIGTGVLALPYGVSRVGVLPALCLFALAGFAASASNIILFRCAHKTGLSSYGELMTGILGRTGAMLLDAFVFVEGLAAVSTYFVFIMDYVPQICELGGPDVWCTDRGKVVTVAGLIVWPLSCLKGLSALRWTSTCSLVTIIFTALVVVVKAPSLFAKTGVSFIEASSGFQGGVLGSFQVLSMACFAFMVHSNTPEIAHAMLSRRPSSIKQVVVSQAGILWAAYALLAMGGYLSFLAETNQDFLTNYEVYDFLIIICRSLLSVTLIFACPINAFPSIQALFNIFEDFRQEPADGESKVALYDMDLVRVPVATACVAISLFVAIRTPHIAELIGGIGAFLSSPLMFAFPAMMYVRILKGRDMFLPIFLMILTFALWGAELMRLMS